MKYSLLTLVVLISMCAVFLALLIKATSLTSDLMRISLYAGIVLCAVLAVVEHRQHVRASYLAFALGAALWALTAWGWRDEYDLQGYVWASIARDADGHPVSIGDWGFSVDGPEYVPSQTAFQAVWEIESAMFFGLSCLMLAHIALWIRKNSSRQRCGE